MAGLNAGLSSMDVSSVAAPLQGFPLMFHDDGALSPSLLRIAFTAAAVQSQANPLIDARTTITYRALSSETNTFNRISLGRLLSLRSRPPRARKQQKEQQHRGDRDTAMEETAATQPGLPHLSPCPELARPLCACSLCCSLRISLKQVADRIEPIRGNGQKCHRAAIYRIVQ